jgi:hypothetical protein
MGTGRRRGEAGLRPLEGLTQQPAPLSRQQARGGGGRGLRVLQGSVGSRRGGKYFETCDPGVV